MKYNLHTHSFYCGHGEGRIEEYCSYSKEKRFEILGFSEHLPLPNNLFAKTRMAKSDMALYEEDVKREKDKDKTIFLGYECDYFPHFSPWFDEIKKRTDYLISGTHFVKKDDAFISPFYIKLDKEDLENYVASIENAASSNLFLFIAHPDMILESTPYSENVKSAMLDIIDIALTYDIPLEMNANGINKAKMRHEEKPRYPSDKFWALAEKKGIKTVLSSDAHQVKSLDSSYKELLEFSFCFKGLDFQEPYIKGDGSLALRSQN